MRQCPECEIEIADDKADECPKCGFPVEVFLNQFNRLWNAAKKVEEKTTKAEAEKATKKKGFLGL